MNRAGKLAISAVLGFLVGPPVWGAPALEANIYVNLSKKVVPSVVNISTVSTVKSPYRMGSPEELFRKFFEDLLQRQGGGSADDGGEEDSPAEPVPVPKLPKAMSLGTGFIIDASGLILTNNHVVAGADEIKVFFTEAVDEKPTDAVVVGRDPELDLALIRVSSRRPMVALPLGDSDSLEVGEYVMAVGNPFGQGHSVTHGIISAKGRRAPDFDLANYLQTDAPINPGNSGGPLVNLKGEVIGINNAIDQRAQGIGFAIPISLVKSVLPQLKSKGSVSRGYIGVLVNELTPEIAVKLGVGRDVTAPFVTQVYPGEPADKAGLKPYDVILEFAGKPLHSAQDLVMAVVSVQVDSTVEVKVSRAGKVTALQLKVGQRPGSGSAAKPGPSDRKGKTPRPQVDVGMELRNSTGGVLIGGVTEGGPAERAGLMRGDLIVEIDQKPLHSTEEFFKAVREKKSYLLRVKRPDPQGRDSYAIVLLDLGEAGK